MATNGLGKRLDDLERAVIVGQDHHHHQADVFMARIFARAARIAASPGPVPSPDQQSPADRAIRGALADAEGSDTLPEHAARFWQAFLRRLRIERKAS